ncbi:hypothetical protein EV426DRAFT_716006 [Tirmania nivea]|nr:hypothetical protein EV426DRAFT_716006 [Tirmania nivea]
MDFDFLPLPEEAEETSGRALCDLSTPESEQRQLPTPAATPVRHKDAHEASRTEKEERVVGSTDEDTDREECFRPWTRKGKEPGWLDSEDEADLEGREKSREGGKGGLTKGLNTSGIRKVLLKNKIDMLEGKLEKVEKETKQLQEQEVQYWKEKWKDTQDRSEGMAISRGKIWREWAEKEDSKVAGIQIEDRMEKKEKVKKQAVEVDEDIVMEEKLGPWSLYKNEKEELEDSSPLLSKKSIQTIEVKGRSSPACQQQGHKKYCWTCHSKCCQHEGFR